MRKWVIYIVLIGINMLYACVSLFTKYASQQDFMSWNYVLGLIGAVSIMGLYAVLWQQVLKRIELSLAYMFKGTSLISVMLLANFIFGEQITWNNIVGAIIIISGIVLFANSAEPIANRQSPIAK
ncbi:MAG: EamA family transporter [Paludibacteraceae bacterium]|nr:EamA family transporter [Paludibacteraceae bacterium]